jgi:hypothetical protein
LTRAEPLGFFTISSIVPDTFDFDVVNCEPTVRVAFDILLPIYFDLLPTFVDTFIIMPTYDIIKSIWQFIYNISGGKSLYFLTCFLARIVVGTPAPLLQGARVFS